MCKIAELELDSESSERVIDSFDGEEAENEREILDVDVDDGSIAEF